MAHKTPLGGPTDWGWGSARQIHKTTVTHDGGATQAILTVEDGTMVEAVIVEVTETWDGGAGLAFTVGDGNDADGFVEDLVGDLGGLGYFNLEHDLHGDYIWDSVNKHRIWYIYDGADTIDAFVNAGDGGSQGECVVYVVVNYLKG